MGPLDVFGSGHQMGKLRLGKAILALGHMIGKWLISDSSLGAGVLEPHSDGPSSLRTGKGLCAHGQVCQLQMRPRIQLQASVSSSSRWASPLETTERLLGRLNAEGISSINVGFAGHEREAPTATTAKG